MGPKEADEVKAALLLVAVVAPSLIGLTAEQGPRAYYVLQAVQAGGLFYLLRPTVHTLAWRVVCWFGLFVQITVAAYGVLMDDGIVQAGGLMALLFVFFWVAEVVAQGTRRPWKTKKT